MPVASFKIGDEEIKHTELRVGDIDLESDDMLLGADFFLSHRVMVARSQRKLYFTYNGGPVFNLEHTQEAASPPATGSANPADAPATADGYSRRGAAFASRHEYDSAIADFDRAVALAPADPKFLIARGRAYRAKDRLTYAHWQTSPRR